MGEEGSLGISDKSSFVNVVPRLESGDRADEAVIDALLSSEIDILLEVESLLECESLLDTAGSSGTGFEGWQVFVFGRGLTLEEMLGVRKGLRHIMCAQDVCCRSGHVAITHPWSACCVESKRSGFSAATRVEGTCYVGSPPLIALVSMTLAGAELGLKEFWCRDWRASALPKTESDTLAEKCSIDQQASGDVDTCFKDVTEKDCKRRVG